VRKVWILVIALASINLLAIGLGWLLNYSWKYFLIFHLVYYLLIGAGVLTYYTVILKHFGTPEQEKKVLTHDDLSKIVMEFIRKEESVIIGKTKEKGMRKIGAPNEPKQEIFYWWFTDRDSGRDYCVGINKSDPEVRNYAVRNYSEDFEKWKKQIREMLSDLADSKEVIETTTEVVSDPMSGRNVTKTTMRPHVLNKEVVPQKPAEDL
jgi:hypothetical protein